MPKQQRKKAFSLCFLSIWFFFLCAWRGAGRVFWRKVPFLWKNYTLMLNVCKLQSSAGIGNYEIGTE